MAGSGIWPLVHAAATAGGRQSGLSEAQTWASVCSPRAKRPQSGGLSSGARLAYGQSAAN
jgi:hypothetical protein